MEKQAEYSIINIPNIKKEQAKPFEDATSPKKRNRGVRLLRVALFMMRGRSAKASVIQPYVNDHDGYTKSTWNKFVRSMMRLENRSPRSPNTTSSSSPYSESYVSDIMAEEEPYSPSPTSSTRYASAVGLNELVQNDEQNEKQEVIVDRDGDGEGDESIDAKADDFIARFYQQIKLQRLDTVDRHYMERNQRSLGF